MCLAARVLRPAARFPIAGKSRQKLPRGFSPTPTAFTEFSPRQSRPASSRLDGWRCMPKVESDLWWRAHSHPMSTSGPPPPVTTELMRVGQRLLIGIRSPAKRPTAPDASPTSSRQGTVHDVINAAVERAQSFAPARVEAFGRILAPANWVTIDRLSESSEVRVRASRPPYPRARASIPAPIAPFSVPFSRIFARPGTRAIFRPNARRPRPRSPAERSRSVPFRCNFAGKDGSLVPRRR